MSIVKRSQFRSASQVVFVVLPWVVFLVMAALPATLLYTQMPRIQAGAKLSREAELVQAARKAPAGFARISRRLREPS